MAQSLLFRPSFGLQKITNAVQVFFCSCKNVWADAAESKLIFFLGHGLRITMMLFLRCCVLMPFLEEEDDIGGGGNASNFTLGERTKQ